MSWLHWAAQFVLAFAFLFTGGSKLFAYDRLVRTLESRPGRKEIFISKPQAVVVGLLEVSGALALLVPSALLPNALAADDLLVRLAAAGLALLMVVAGIYHLEREEPAAPAVSLFLLAVLVVFEHWPH